MRKTNEQPNEIADLKRQLEEARWQLYSDGELLNKIESELLGVKYAGPYDAGIRAIKQQLAESQARESRLRELVPAFKPYYGEVGTRDCDVAKKIAAYDAALEIPHDDTALREYRDAVIDDCIATTNQVLDGLEGADNVADALRVMKGGA